MHLDFQPYRLLDSGLEPQEILYWTGIRTAKVLSCTSEFGWQSTPTCVAEGCNSGSALKLYSISCCKNACSCLRFCCLGCDFPTVSQPQILKGKIKDFLLSVKKKKNPTVSLTSTEIQSDFTMGIRPATCLPTGYEVLGMETRTLSPEQGSCRRSVGKLTHLTQITPSRVSQWPQHTLQTHRQSVPPRCSTGLLRGWEPLVATQLLQGLCSDSTRPKPRAATTRLSLLCCWAQTPVCVSAWKRC